VPGWVHDEVGTGSAAAINFATLAPNLVLTSADFLVFRWFWVASIISISVSCACAASSVLMVAKTPLRLYRFHLLSSVLGGPYAVGVCFHLGQ
jgi:hypothetical protein